MDRGGRAPGWMGVSVLPCLVAFVAPAMAQPRSSPAPSVQQQAAPVTLPAQPLERAIAALADRLGFQVVFDPAAVAGRTAPALRGRFGAPDGLRRLLAGSGLEAVPVDARTWLLRPSPKPPAATMRPMVRKPPLAAPVEAEPAVWPELIVTAARFNQSAHKTALSLAVVPGDQLAGQGIHDTEQALTGLPAISSSRQPEGVSINMRGLGADMPSGTTQGSVALEFDGVYSILWLGTGLGWYDVNRVEISRGPQSTRYGPNAEGGVVNVLTRRPQLGDSSGQAVVTAGSAALVRGEFGQNVPLGETAALRISGTAIRRDSWFEPALATIASQALRGQVLVEPGPGFRLRFTAEVGHMGGTGTGAEATVPFLLDKVAPYAGDSINATGNPWRQGDTAGEGQDFSRNHANLWQAAFTGQAGMDLGAGAAVDLTVAHQGVSGHQTICPHDGAPWAVTGAGSCYGVREFAPFAQNSAELRFHSTDAAPLRWTVGQYLWAFDRAGWAEANQVVAGPDGGSRIGSRTLALFAEATVPVAPGWRAVGGLRQSWDRRSLKPVSVSEYYRADFHHTDFRLGIERDLGEAGLAYATLSSGYRPGGLTYDGAAATALRFASQTTLALEGGIKGRAGRWLQFSLAGFAYRQRNYQDIDNYNGFSVTLADGAAYVCQSGGDQPAECSVPVFNIARASNLGLELSAQVRLDGNDRFDLDAAAMRARFGTDLPACAQVAAPTTPGCWIGYNDQQTGALRFYRVDGTAQPHSPALSLNLRYAHSFTLPSGARIELQGQAFHSSGYWVGPIQDEALIGWQPAYWQGHLTASLSDPAGRWTVSAYLRNITNYAVKESALPATTIGDPRNFGLTLRRNW